MKKEEGRHYKKPVKKKKNKKRRRRVFLSLLIIIMLLASAYAVTWLAEYGIENNRRHTFVISIVISGGVTLNSAVINSSEHSVLQTLIAEAAAKHVYSHRGTAGDNEHTFDAYDQAIAAGSHIIELDVVRSKDNVLFVSHSKNAVIMTGNNALYSVMTSKEIEKLRTFAGNKVLHLYEVFDRYETDITFVLDVKIWDDDTMKALSKLVDKYENQDRIIVMSHMPEYLKKLKKRYPEMTTLYPCRTQEELDEYKSKPYVDILSVPVESNLLTAENSDAVHAEGKLFCVWTITTEEEIKHAIDLKVDVYYTDDTPLALAIEKEYGIQHRQPQF